MSGKGRLYVTIKKPLKSRPFVVLILSCTVYQSFSQNLTHHNPDEKINQVTKIENSVSDNNKAHRLKNTLALFNAIRFDTLEETAKASIMKKAEIYVSSFSKMIAFC